MFKFLEKKYNLFIIRQYWKIAHKCSAVFCRKSYSLDGEDMVMDSFFETNPDYKGFYVDIGAHHPFKYSNTQYFYEKGWTGINIDAMPGSMKEFNYYRKKDINLEMAVSSSSGEMEFFMFKTAALNTFDKKLATEYQAVEAVIKTQIIKTYTINEILEKYLPENTNIDILNIDIEGLDFEIIKSYNWQKYSPNFIIAESLDFMDKSLIEINSKSELVNFLSSAGYAPVAKTKRAIIFRRL